jgi:hypothetical protein
MYLHIRKYQLVNSGWRSAIDLKIMKQQFGRLWMLSLVMISSKFMLSRAVSD